MRPEGNQAARGDGPVRVLAITNLFPNLADPGRAPFNRYQFRALRDHARVRVVAPVFWTAPRARAVAAAEAEDWDGIVVHHPLYVYPPGIGRAVHSLCYSASIAGTLKRLWRDEPWDVLYGTFLFPDGHAVARAARRFGTPCVLKAHGSDVNAVDRHPIRRILIRRAVGHAKAVVAVSRALGERLAALGTPATKIHLLYNGVDTKTFRPMDRGRARRALRLPADERLILFVGNLKPAKGPGILVEAIERLESNGGAATTIILGGGSYRQALEGEIRNRGLERRVRLVGVAAHDQMPTWYAAADVVCLPSLMEGVPNVVLESLACGRPVVATRVGGIPEAMDGTCGALVAPGDVRALTDAIAGALAVSWDPDALARRVAHRSWETNARDLARILDEAAGGQL